MSLIQNALKMAEAKNGTIDEWGSVQACIHKNAQGECIKYYFDNYIAPELQVVKTCQPTSDECWTSTKSLSGETGYLPNGTNWSKGVISALLKNGSAIYLWAGGEDVENSRHLQIWIDIDGPKKGKNMLGADVFGLRVNIDNGSAEGRLKKGVTLIGAELVNSKTRSELLSGEYGCSEDIEGIVAGRVCGALIQLDGWKISDDYPVKF